HVGLRRALAYADADAGAHQVDARGDDLATLDQLVERGAVSEEDVDRLAALAARGQRAPRRVAGAGDAGAGALERWQQFVGCSLDCGRDERVDLSGAGGADRSDERSDDCERAHDIPPGGGARALQYGIDLRKCRRWACEVIFAPAPLR